MYHLIKYLFFIFWLGCMLISAMLLFTRGFLLNREVLNFQSSCKSQSSMGFCDLMFNSTSLNEVNGEKILECTEENVLSKQLNSKMDSSQYCFNNNIKVILLLIDALKYDFAHFNDSLSLGETPPYKNKLTVIHDVLESIPERGKLLKFIADPPTTTMQRLNGLTTGSLPTFIDIGSNFDTSEINEDNLIDQLVKSKKRITFMGDETLTFMYPGRFTREFPYPSFNVWDLDSVDTNVKAKLEPEIQKKDWDLIIAHFLGVDHCGHRYGPNHSEMKRKLLEMNEVIRDVMKQMDNNTMLFVIGDHGMTGTGEHGGDSEEEITSAMFVYSPRPFVANIEPVEEVRQVDLVPTLASILGVPIPFSNVGSIILNVLPSFGSKPDLKSNWEYVVTAFWTNIKQITLYIQEYAKNTDQFLPEKLVEINNNYQQLRIMVENIGDERELSSFIRDSYIFTSNIRTMCQEAWAQFDTSAMSRGLVLYFLLLAFAFILIEGLPIHYLDEVVENIITHLAYVIVILIAIVLCVLKYVDVLLDIEQHFYFCVCIFSMTFLGFVNISHWPIISNNWYNISKTSTIVNVICRLIMLFSVVGLFSNSFIINEAFINSFLVTAMVFTSVLEIKGDTPKKPTKTFDLMSSLKSFLYSSRGRAVTLSFAFFALVRFSLLYVVCRSEQNCTIEKPLLSDSTRCLLSIVFIALFITCVRLYLRSAGNLVGISPTVFVSRYASTAVVIATGGFWVLQALPRNTQHKLFEPWQLTILPRTAMCILLASLALLLVRPLSVYHLTRQSTSVSHDNIIPALFKQLKEVMVRRTGSDVKGYPVVFGLATAYSAAFLNVSVFLTLLAALLLDSEQGLAAVLLTLLLWLVATISSITRHSKGDIGEVPWWNVVAWGLSSLHFFYATGHQATFSSINWNTAFLLSAGSTLSSHLVPGMLVLGNVFSSHILHAVLLPLLLVMPHTLSTFSPRLALAADAKRAELTLFEKDSQMNRAMFKLCLQYMLFFAQRVFCCMLAACIHARHLMVWSVFAPKLIFEGVAFIITLPSMIIGFFILQQITTRLDRLLQSLRR